jgi:uncharacterized protein (TIGR00288 family)
MEDFKISQSVAILIDGNNIGMSIHNGFKNKSMMLDYEKVIPKLLNGRGLCRFYFFREGDNISEKLSKRLQEKFCGITVPCGKSADVRIAITAVELASKVDTIILMSGDSDFIPLVEHLKSHGVRVEVVGVSGFFSKELIKVSDYHYCIVIDDCFQLLKGTPKE